MTPPINIDGSSVADITIDGTSVSEVTVDGSTVFSEIPNSVTTRPSDDSTGTGTSQDGGVQITLSSDWPSIGAQISDNTLGATRAYLIDSSGNQIKSVDISGLSAGDSFSFDNVNLTAGNTFVIYINAEGSGYDIGFANTTSYTFGGADLDITAGYSNGVNTSHQPRGVNNIGNTGL